MLEEDLGRLAQQEDEQFYSYATQGEGGQADREPLLSPFIFSLLWAAGTFLSTYKARA